MTYLALTHSAKRKGVQRRFTIKYGRENTTTKKVCLIIVSFEFNETVSAPTIHGKHASNQNQTLYYLTTAHRVV